MTIKQVTPQSITGQLGANLIERIVLQMGSVWRPILIFDVGVDGEIEICDPVTGAATNTIIRVQAKATTSSFLAETAESFEYTCTQKDLDYWLRGNAPIILIVCRPETDEAYWVSVKDYFKDPQSQRARKIHFNKLGDRFDTACAPLLKELALPKDSGIYFAPLPKRELLYTNLLQIASFAPEIYIADTDCRVPGDIWSEFKSQGITAGPEWMLSNKRIISFHNLSKPPFDSICDAGNCEPFDTDEWAYSDDKDKQKEFVRLLNLCLRERTRLQGLRVHKVEKRQYYYFPATRSGETHHVQYRSRQRQTSREVFKQYFQKKNQTKLAYCRHSAFKGHFLRIDDTWYLEITPTYHFTFNGYQEDKFHAERLKGIKKLERNPAVLGSLLMWAEFLRKSTENLFMTKYPFLSFGNLLTVEMDTGLPDEVWYKAEDGEEAVSMKADENQLSWLNL